MIFQTKEILNDISNKRDFNEHKLKRLWDTKYSVRDYEFCFCLLKRLMKRMTSLALRDRDIKAFVYQNSCI